jgi:hypothetical protein
MAITVLPLTITVHTDTDGGMDTAHIGGAGITEVITAAGIMVEDITGAGTPADIVAATDTTDPQRRICPRV